MQLAAGCWPRAAPPLSAACWRWPAGASWPARWRPRQPLAYGVPVWWVQAAHAAGLRAAGLKLGARCAGAAPGTAHASAVLAAAAGGAGGGLHFDGHAAAGAGRSLLLLLLLAGAPIFAVLGGLALALFWSDGTAAGLGAAVALPDHRQPLAAGAAAVHAGRAGAGAHRRAQRLGALFIALFGGGVRGTVLAAALLCSAFTAFTGGSGVTILALGGLLLPLLRHAGYPSSAASAWSPAPARWGCCWRPRCR
jgi:C4-dicarboxylate transporter DctM subunit